MLWSMRSTASSTSPFSPYLAVHASAGSGKTHQLVNRLIYLLLQGAEPGGILAITFTRKAAAEMTQRLLQRVQSLCTDNTQDLVNQLTALNIRPDPEMCQRATELYEQLLHTPYPVRSTTFHAFCQDLLRRFPMEADVPPGFELVELTRQFLDEAWDSLASELTRDPDSQLARAMDELLHRLGLPGTRRVLSEFVEHRSDWWALTLGEEHPVGAVQTRISQYLEIDPRHDPYAAFLQQPQRREELQVFHALLLKHPTEANTRAALQIETGLREDLAKEVSFEELWSAFYKQDSEPYKRKASKVLSLKLGADGCERFIALHEQLCEQLAQVRREQHALDTLHLSQAWLVCGEALLRHFQRIKQNQRVLDFADLEWNSFLLLNTASHADWIQYKLDQRIDHLLVDEFQDTNPIQWRLLLPLLQELAAAENDRQRSVMFVGDSKQSIYSFRRAEPRLFDAATDWLKQHLPDTQEQTLSKSWRSSPAVIGFVNRVFENNPDLPISHFEKHETAHPQMHGAVWLLPLAGKEKESKPDGLRNPLTTPRPQSDAAHYHEACRIADTIQRLVRGGIQVGRNENRHRLGYADIIILFRSRTSVSDYERALREAHIPYIGTERGTLLESLEVSDMITLLQWLITPFNNLALAGILRSPLFAVSDDDLQNFAGERDWYAHLLKLALELPDEHALARAARHLQRWTPLADALPVHDLLDQIYSEGNVIERYRAAFPEHLHPRIMANLTRFLELALENDSGRYPSLTRFMIWLDELRQLDKDAPSQPPGQGEQDRVRLLTVHEAKGLEAPVIFVADTSRKPRNETGTRSLIEWPADHPVPQHFMLIPGGRFPNPACARIMQRLQEKQDQEDANLLYVALTRAEHYLYISAANKAESWYQHICRAYDIDAGNLDEPVCLENQPVAPDTNHTDTAVNEPPLQAVNPGLRKVLTNPEGIQEIAPSRRAEPLTGGRHEIDEDSRERGIIIHAMLEALADQPQLTASAFAARFNHVSRQQLDACWQEARAVITAFPALFETAQFEQAYNEVAVIYEYEGRTVHGVIDRLVCYPDRIDIIDYKTHRFSDTDDPRQIAEAYREQLRLYTEGVCRIFPGKAVNPHILFTNLPQSIALTT